MGQDKARLQLGERSLIEHALAVLDPLCERTFLGTGAEPRYRDLRRELVLDRAPLLGPLAGLEAGLAAAAAQGGADALVCVLACDMPCADARAFAALLARCESDALDASWAVSQSGPEPLFAVYRATLLPSVRAALAAGERRMLAFERFPRADGLLPRTGQLELDAQLACNVNTPADLERVRAWSIPHAGALA